MPFLQLTLMIGSADPAPFEDALLAAGASSITLLDAKDDPILEPAPGTTPLWPSVQIKALFEDRFDPDAVIAALQERLSQPLPGARFETLADRTWEREWLKHFRPMRFGRRLWVRAGAFASALNVHSRRPDGGAGMHRLAEDPRTAAWDEPKICIVQLDPGLAFGTGTHPTTALCLEWLDAAQLAGKRVVDFGCGSGILAIAALKLGAAEALAVDIDPQALLATWDNAVRNGVEKQLTVQPAASMKKVEADIVLANILAEPLEQLAPVFADFLVAGGRVVMSGILHTQAQTVASRYAAWFDIAPATVRDDWARLDGVRRSTPRAC